MNSGVWEEVGCARFWNERCRTSDTTHLSPAEAFCVFYHLKSNPSVVLCQCSCYVAEDQQHQWLEKVFGSCPRKNMQVTVLTCRHVTDYKTSESTSSLHSPFLKALKTQNFKDPPCCSLLEQPNIVHDLPAAVLSHCQVWKIPAVLYLCYTDVMKLDLITVEAFTPVLSSRSLKGLVKVRLARPLVAGYYGARTCLPSGSKPPVSRSATELAVAGRLARLPAWRGVCARAGRWGGCFLFTECLIWEVEASEDLIQ
ncbi:PREDICTED: proteasome assembly chaperone 1 [Condylura cristata]|uniref:proteasome assembly chaperone 1 n=1 Tax=Condylura cristata TaxID=143302 RepID=UPI0006439A60|nr:PREDICTED: proteasome assembly chaperone 1 [Condylura cristata]